MSIASCNIRDISWCGRVDSITGRNPTRGGTSSTGLLLLVWAPWSGPSFCPLTVLFCPTDLLFSWFICLGVHFFILPIACTHVLVFRIAMFFLMWIFSHMWISSDMWMLFHMFSVSFVCFQSDSYPHLITGLCHCLLLGSCILVLISPSGVQWHCCGIGQWHGPPGDLGLHFSSANLCRHFLPIWPSIYLYCKDRASGPYKNAYFNHILFERQIRDFMCLW